MDGVRVMMRIEGRAWGFIIMWVGRGVCSLCGAWVWEAVGCWETLCGAVWGASRCKWGVVVCRGPYVCC